MTTGISLVRENTESMRPPRSLWVTFPLGRPLGKPNDAAFQHRVISAALILFDSASGPVLADYPENLPSVEADNAPACPVSFHRPTEHSGSWASKLLGELEELRPWHALGHRRRGRSLIDVKREMIPENLTRIGKLLDENILPLTELEWFKRAIEDAKVFYLEALTSQPGEFNHEEINEIFWQESVLGAVLLQFAEMFYSDEKTRPFARVIAPRQAIEHSKARTKRHD